MKTYIVRISDDAVNDIGAIYHYISETLKAPDAALRQYERIVAAILSLENMPERCRILEIKSMIIKDLRRMVVDNYSLFYFIEGDVVIVTNVLYTASNVEERLK